MASFLQAPLPEGYPPQKRWGEVRPEAGCGSPRVALLGLMPGRGRGPRCHCIISLNTGWLEGQGLVPLSTLRPVFREQSTSSQLDSF